MAGEDLPSRVSAVETDVDWLKDAFNEIRNNSKVTAEAVSRIAALDERHMAYADSLKRAHDGIFALTTKVDTLQQEMPTLRLSRAMVFGFVVWALALTGSILFVAVKVGLSKEMPAIEKVKEP